MSSCRHICQFLRSVRHHRSRAHHHAAIPKIRIYLSVLRVPRLSSRLASSFSSSPLLLPSSQSSGFSRLPSSRSLCSEQTNIPSSLALLIHSLQLSIYWYPHRLHGLVAKSSIQIKSRKKANNFISFHSSAHPFQSLKPTQPRNALTFSTLPSSPSP